MRKIFLAPSEIRFTQEFISDDFSDGRTLKETFTALVHGQLTVKGIQTIACVKLGDHYWVIHGNRRLFLYKILEEENMIEQVRVNLRPFLEKPFMERFSSTNLGISVVCQQNENLSEELKDIASSFCIDDISLDQLYQLVKLLMERTTRLKERRKKRAKKAREQLQVINDPNDSNRVNRQLNWCRIDDTSLDQLYQLMKLLIERTTKLREGRKKRAKKQGHSCRSSGTLMTTTGLTDS